MKKEKENVGELHHVKFTVEYVCHTFDGPPDIEDIVTWAKEYLRDCEIKNLSRKYVSSDNIEEICLSLGRKDYIPYLQYHERNSVYKINDKNISDMNIKEFIKFKENENARITQP